MHQNLNDKTKLSLSLFASIAFDCRLSLVELIFLVVMEILSFLLMIREESSTVN